MLTQERYQRLCRAAVDGSLRGRHLNEALDALAEVQPDLGIKRGPKRVILSRVIDNVANLDEVVQRSGTVRRVMGTVWDVAIEDAEGQEGGGRETGAVRIENARNLRH